MGSLAQIAELLRGPAGRAAGRADPPDVERTLKLSEAIIRSMTVAVSRDPGVLVDSRRRIALEAGTTVQDVDWLIKQFRRAQKLFKVTKGASPRRMMRLLG